MDLVTREGKLARYLLEIAEQAMPDTYLQSDSRCQLAREVLNEYRLVEEAFNDPNWFKAKIVESGSPEDVSFVFPMKLDGNLAIKFSELASERGMNPLQLLRELVDMYVDRQSSA